ncbi:PIG-L family deacetylase [Blautia pseudococcoides]|uniref:PIG-L deacetylase family protein n=1 Tax=Blautia pseudococcoides TaxID=1796616 RepID=UPI00148B1FBB|nr:PIG-L family deacetylase [Blautia pseudococcoides]QJU15961.1 hypothetical protein HL650_16900 [Blautia pseudococcoides]
MKRKLIISPHPDDAAFSLGGFILKYQGNNFVIWDVFSNQNYTITKKHTHMNDIMLEENRAISYMGCEVIYSHLPEIQMRENIPLSKILNSQLTEKEKFLITIIKNEISRICKEWKIDEIYIPMGCGKHIDHLIVKEALFQFAKENHKTIQFYIYEELPYALNSEWRDISLSVFIRDNYDLEVILINISDYIKQKEHLLKIYRSQIGTTMINRIINYAQSFSKHMSAERIWKIS